MRSRRPDLSAPASSITFFTCVCVVHCFAPNTLFHLAISLIKQCAVEAKQWVYVVLIILIVRYCMF